MTALAPTLEAFFTDRLMTQKGVSPKTIATYRDAFRLLLGFVHEQTAKQPSELDFADLDAALIATFLNHLEQVRGNSPRTRNNRLAAIHSFYKYSAFRHPEHAATIARVLEIPMKRYERNGITYLDREEIEALLTTPDRTTWLGRRDYALLLTTIQTGVRVSELTNLRIGDVSLNTGAHCRITGKGRKRRIAPLKPETVAVLREWLHERGGDHDEPLFPTRQGRQLSRDAVAKLLRKHIAAATGSCPSLTAKRVSPHALRHTNAMLLRAERTDIATIALWLGHESIKTAYIYQHADNKLKQEAIERTAPIGTPPGRYQPPDQLLGFLESL
jgi:site-specific recombinase XerD